VAQFYDMDLLDAHMQECVDVFGPTFEHRIAIKSNSITKMLQHACKKFPTFGIECASIGEVLHAIEHCGIHKDKIVYDSPCKTVQEMEWAIREKIYTNLDNFDEFERAKAYVEKNGWHLDDKHKETMGVIGMRINPLVGAGEIAALSVSTADSKFGTPISNREQMLETYLKHPWMNSVHVHVGSGGMGVKVLASGIKVIVELANEVNEKAGFQQITHLDIGGGLPANYKGDTWGNPDANVPTYGEYATHLKEVCPDLFSGKYKICTEFGQSMNAKSGFLASRVEYVKGTPENPIAIIHFGGAECIRQVYGGAPHNRRIEAYQADGSRFGASAAHSCVVVDRDAKTGDEKERKEVSGEEMAAECYGKLTQGTGNFAIGGPLCFQGDFVAKQVIMPKSLKPRDFVVMKDGGANTMSIFSRHCSRMAPGVFGYRMNAEGTQVTEFIELKPREVAKDVSRFWGPTF
jgi:diaminopimelate decarboxylase